MRALSLLLVLSACSFEEAPRPGPRPPAPEPVVVEPLTPPHETFDSSPACRAFVDHVNGLACVPEDARLDPALVCARGLDTTPCDTTAWWACATEHTTCTGGVLSRAGVSDCPGPCLAGID